MSLSPSGIRYIVLILLTFLITSAAIPAKATETDVFTESMQDSLRPKIPPGDSAYNVHIRKAEMLMLRKDYQNALSEYETARRFKPKDQYTSLQITKVNALLKSQISSQAEYDKRIESADKYFAAKDYLNAKAAYQLALDAKPDDLYAKGKLQECMEKLRSMKASNILYDVAIASGDKFFQAKDYKKAMEQYENAAKILPNDKVAKDRINEIIRIMIDEQSREENYANAIKAGDDFYNAKKYQNSLIEYKKALVQKPDEKYPQDRIAELTDILAKQKNADESYKKAIASADQLFNAKSYDKARPLYEEAGKIKPAETYPPQKIAQIDYILAELKKSGENYQYYVDLADSFYVEKKYINAKANYQQALKVKPAEAYPKEMITKAENLLATQQMSAQAVEEAYRTAIAAADKSFADKDYTSAKGGYETASGMKPAESYPKTKITEINNLLAAIEKQKLADQEALAARQKAISDSIANAEKTAAELLVLRQKHIADSTAAAKLAADEAQKAAAAALALRQKHIADSTTAAQRSTEEALALRQKQIADSTAAAKKAADEALTLRQKHVADSIAASKALALRQKEIADSTAAAKKAADAALALRLKQIEDSTAAAKRMADEALTLRQKHIADSTAAAKKAFEDALTARQKQISDSIAAEKQAADAALALRLKQIADSTAAAKRSAEEALALKQKQAEDSIAAAKALVLRQKQEADSLASVKKAAEAALALRLKQEADSIAAVKKAAEEALAQRNQHIADSTAAAKKAADEAYALRQKEIADSVAAVKKAAAEALALRQKHISDSTAVADAEKLRLAAEKAVNDKYKVAVENADRLLAAKTYDQAKTAYLNASTIKPGEQYPKDKITEIETVLDNIAKAKALDDQYKTALAKAEQLFTSGSLVEARAGFVAAGELKPSEPLPPARITAIDKVLGDQKAIDDKYNEMIASGDKLLADKSYEQARAAYQSAAQIKTAEKYPKDQVTMIDKTVAELTRQKVLDDKYNASLAKADKLFSEKNYVQAKAEYGNSITLKPAETYPKDRISEIDGIVAEMKVKDDAYTASVTKANGLLAQKSYEEARAEYQTASDIKPDEQFPKTKITEINNLLMELKGKKATFDELIAKADDDYGQKNYKKAKDSYSQALNIFPDETHPKQRIARITAISDSIYRANKGLYDKAIADADKAYNSLIFDKAIESYNLASSFLPDETYPKDMIIKIKKTISENAMVDVLTTTTIIKAGAETKFPFPSVNMSNRKNNYVYIKIRNLSEKPFNVLLRYGKDNAISGGAVIRNLETTGQLSDRLISFADQDPWYRVDNNYISLYPQGGDVEVTFIQISRAVK